MPEKAPEKPQPGVRCEQRDVEQRRLCLQTTAWVSGQIPVAATTPPSRQASAATQTPTTSSARSPESVSCTPRDEDASVNQLQRPLGSNNNSSTRRRKGQQKTKSSQRR
ncbi:unnamed protein product [Pleuronectes platessa]|uniref:Uncharacterized protein n=1 Tax=Pleuronectes platessa TaxID=8262 RepID=A0A9N7TNF7_PLEPL|nr:unnamed protein product [Pleuronectes platessa]